MKAKNLCILLFVLIVFSSCEKLDIAKDTPSCIEELIKDFDRAEACESGVNVKNYTFQNETVFVFDPGSCGADMTSEVFDAECNSLGFLGGIEGNTEINGEDFSNATLVATTWER